MSLHRCLKQFGSHQHFVLLFKVFIRLFFAVVTENGWGDGGQLSPHETLVLHLLRLGKPACP
jgi:hypothetical protein